MKLARTYTANGEEFWVSESASGVLNCRIQEGILDLATQLAIARIQGRSNRGIHDKETDDLIVVRNGCLLEILISIIAKWPLNYWLYAKGDGKADWRWINAVGHLVTVDAKCHNSEQGFPYLYADPEHNDPFLTIARIQGSLIAEDHVRIWGGISRPRFELLSYDVFFTNYWDRPCVRCTTFQDGKGHGTDRQIVGLRQLIAGLEKTTIEAHPLLPDEPERIGTAPFRIAEAAEFI